MTLYHEADDGSHAVFVKVDESQAITTRNSANRYSEIEIRTDDHQGTKYASVDCLPNGDVTLHSTADYPQAAVSTTKFVDALKALPNQSMWKDLKMDEEGEWVREGLIAGMLVMVHDWSYNEGLDPTKSSAAYGVMCTKSKKELRGSVVESSEHASNYRAELLGALCCLLIIKAAQDSGTGNGVVHGVL